MRRREPHTATSQLHAAVFHNASTPRLPFRAVDFSEAFAMAAAATTFLMAYQ
jgi:hypothetical protein